MKFRHMVTRVDTGPNTLYGNICTHADFKILSADSAVYPNGSMELTFSGNHMEAFRQYEASRRMDLFSTVFDIPLPDLMPPIGPATKRALYRVSEMARTSLEALENQASVSIHYELRARLVELRRALDNLDSLL